MAGNTYTVFNAMVDIVASPGKALVEIKQHTSWLWWPLLAGILLASGLFIYYYSWVDFPWLVEETIRALPAEDRAESEGVIRQFMTPGSSMWMAVIMIVLMSFLIYGVQAIYLLLANKLTTGTQLGFGNWFSFSVWTGFVGVFGSLAGFVAILMADSNQLAQHDLYVLSFNALLIHAAPGGDWFEWANSLHLTHVWTLFLMCIGYARWTNTTIMKSTIIVLLPWLLIFGIWALTV